MVLARCGQGSDVLFIQSCIVQTSFIIMLNTWIGNNKYEIYFSKTGVSISNLGLKNQGVQINRSCGQAATGIDSYENYYINISE